MQQQKECKLEDMIQFLLALCRLDETSTAPVTRDAVVDRCYEDCLSSATLLAKSTELSEKLEI
jgi:hypothetical protein